MVHKLAAVALVTNYKVKSTCIFGRHFGFTKAFENLINVEIYY